MKAEKALCSSIAVAWTFELHLICEDLLSLTWNTHSSRHISSIWLRILGRPSPNYITLNTDTLIFTCSLIQIPLRTEVLCRDQALLNFSVCADAFGWHLQIPIVPKLLCSYISIFGQSWSDYSLSPILLLLLCFGEVVLEFTLLAVTP